MSSRRSSFTPAPFPRRCEVPHRRRSCFRPTRGTARLPRPPRAGPGDWPYRRRHRHGGEDWVRRMPTPGSYRASWLVARLYCAHRPRTCTGSTSHTARSNSPQSIEKPMQRCYSGSWLQQPPRRNITTTSTSSNTSSGSTCSWCGDRLSRCSRRSNACRVSSRNGQVGNGALAGQRAAPSLHRHTLRQIPRLVHIRPARYCRVIRQQLQRHHVQDR
ncbi:hypothetical protein BH09PSE5_BH09PSE5_22690 [soil metagenome]